MPYVSVLELRNVLDRLIRDGSISEGAVVLWADVVREGSKLQIVEGICPGSVILGVQDGDRLGTIGASPKNISKFVS